MASERAKELAASAWCKPTTSGKVMDTTLAEAFAEILQHGGVTRKDAHR